MSVKNLSQKNYDRFVKNKNIDVFSQEQIKNIPRHRLVMMNNGKGETYWPFHVHGLHNYLKHTNKHPIVRSVTVSPDAKRRIRDKYIASLRHDVKAMLSTSSNVSEDAFIKALKKATLNNAVIDALVKARRTKTVPNAVVQNMRPDTIDHVIRILRANNNKNMTKVPNASKAFVNAQRRKHNDMLWRQQKHQANLELNKNQNALGRASSIAQRVVAERVQNPSKKEFKYPELGFKMTIQDRNTIIMTWYPPSKQRNREGKVMFPPASSSIRVSIQAMKFTNWGYMAVSQNNTNVSRFWFVPEILDPVPGSRASVMQMSKAVLLLMKEKTITDRNRHHIRNNVNNRDYRSTSNNNNSNESNNSLSDAHTFFLGAGMRAYHVINMNNSLNRNTLSNIICEVLTVLRDGDEQTTIDSIYIDSIEVRIGDRPLSRLRKNVHKDIGNVNINKVARLDTFTTINLKQHPIDPTTIREISVSGTFTISFSTNLYDSWDHNFNIVIDPCVLDSVDVEFS
jgi:hypothetical protein